MKEKLFNLLKNLYKKLPVSYKVKNKLKGSFYSMFGFLFKNTTSYRVWSTINTKIQRSDVMSVEKSQIEKYQCNKKIAIQLHLYYVDLLEEFVGYFSNIPFDFDILISMVDRDKAEYVKGAMKKLGHAGNIYVKVVENRGRDVAPFISVFGKEILEYDYICHVHSKKSLFTGGEQTEWRRYLLDGLMGSREVVAGNLYVLEKGDKAGMVYPETFPHMPYQGHTWLKNTGSRDELLTRIGVNAKSDHIYIDYPMGTMFWARVDAIRQFFEADIRVSEFPKEAGQTDGTIAHAFERCLGLVCRYNGYNMLIFDESENTYAYNYGFKNMNQYLVKSYEHMKMEMTSYDVVSFDIFDTLLTRKISDYRSIQKLVENKADIKWKEKTGFSWKRTEAEINLRNRNPGGDCHIDDIYRELKRITGWDENKVNAIKEMEIETEYSLIGPKGDIIDVLKYVKQVLHKEVYLISDMQLRHKDIEKMLDKCGIARADYDELLLSSEMNIRKDNGTMWEYFRDKKQGKKCIHIGDNEVSDVQIPGDYEIANYHVMSNKALFQLSDIGKEMGNIQDTRFSDALELGLVLNSMYSNPFRYNEDKFKVKITEARELGYNFIGPVVLNYILWLMNEAKEAQIQKIFFFAREGYIFKQVFDAVKSYAEGTLGDIEGEYLYVSRRALSMAATENEKDIESPLDIYYEGRLYNLIKKRFGVEIHNVPDEDIKLPDNKNKVLKYLEGCKDKILSKAARERENYLAYFEQQSAGRRAVVSDIGYSGTIQYYLSKITGMTFDGRYMATDEKKKPLAIGGNTIKGYYIDGDGEQEISQSNIHKYHLFLESILMAPDGQLVKINENGIPVFEEEKNILYSKTISDIHEGIVNYARDYARIAGEAVLAELPGKELPEQLIYAIVRSDGISREIARDIVVDDKYCSGEIKSTIDFYQKRN